MIIILEINKIHQGDCLELMEDIPDKSIDLILSDLPYGTTRLKWDSVIDLEKLWDQYNRILKKTGVVVLTASQPFTTILIASNIKNFKYSLVWNKKNISNPQFAKKMPLKQHEDICVFSNSPMGTHTYNPIKSDTEKERTWKQYSAGEMIVNGKGTIKEGNTGQVKGLYPKSILEFSNAKQKGKIHPTQKPVDLMEYLISLYSNEGETVLDNCIGSGTTAIAAINTKRNWIGIEMEEKYVELANGRIENHE